MTKALRHRKHTQQSTALGWMAGPGEQSLAICLDKPQCLTSHLTSICEGPYSWAVSLY